MPGYRIKAILMTSVKTQREFHVQFLPIDIRSSATQISLSTKLSEYHRKHLFKYVFLGFALLNLVQPSKRTLSEDTLLVFCSSSSETHYTQEN